MKKVAKNFIFILLIFTFFCLFYINVPKVSVPFKTAGVEYYYKNGSHGAIKLVDKKNGLLNFNKKGEAYLLSEYLDACTVLDYYGAKVISIEESAWGVSVYAYSEEIKYIKEINDKKINVHLHYDKSNGQVKIGFPMIYGSF